MGLDVLRFPSTIQRENWICSGSIAIAHFCLSSPALSTLVAVRAGAGHARNHLN